MRGSIWAGWPAHPPPHRGGCKRRPHRDGLDRISPSLTQRRPARDEAKTRSALTRSALTRWLCLGLLFPCPFPFPSPPPLLSPTQYLPSPSPPLPLSPSSSSPRLASPSPLPPLRHGSAPPPQNPRAGWAGCAGQWGCRDLDLGLALAGQHRAEHKEHLHLPHTSN